MHGARRRRVGSEGGRPRPAQIVVRGADGRTVEAATDLMVTREPVGGRPRTHPGRESWRGLAAPLPRAPSSVCSSRGGLPAPVALSPRRGDRGRVLFALLGRGRRRSRNLGAAVLAGVTFLTVLPELVIEVRFAFTQQTSLVSANLTGATRLLLTAAVAMPVLGAWLLARRGPAPAVSSPRRGAWISRSSSCGGLRHRAGAARAGHPDRRAIAHWPLLFFLRRIAVPRRAASRCRCLRRPCRSAATGTPGPGWRGWLDSRRQ